MPLQRRLDVIVVALAPTCSTKISITNLNKWEAHRIGTIYYITALTS